MKYNKGFISMAGMIIAIIVALAVGGGAVYLATKTPNSPLENIEVNNYESQDDQSDTMDTTEMTTEDSNDQNQPPVSQNPKEEMPKLLTACASFTGPNNSKDLRQVSVTPDIIVAGWGILGTGGSEDVPGTLNSQSDWQYGVFECKNGTWNQLYLSQKGPAFLTLELLPNQSVLVASHFEGAGTTLAWEVLYNNGIKWDTQSGVTVRDQALTQAGLVFMGYNSISVVSGNIVESLQGNAPGDPRIGPSKPRVNATYSWNGSTLNLVSVQ